LFFVHRIIQHLSAGLITDDINGEKGYGFVDARQRQLFKAGLGGKHAVKRIPVDNVPGAGQLGMFRGDRQWLKTCFYDPVWYVFSH
jgi:hypothetical protein